ncbi:MAG: FAD-dependent oxidoreductase [Gemmatimonadota bacterium]|nr:FAD-dependent oxidoreductase [Gemmatimonadota bacterium]MDH3427268.1 FAD-dependent oxidoreductase [Gemmatimonadota bacterium]
MAVLDPAPAPSAGDGPLRVAVIGAGPAGFYTAGALFKQDDVDVRVDMFNRLPTPYGLVREGVAPDHESIKAVTRVFDRTGDDDRFRFFGNVSIGGDLSVQELQAYYHMLVYAVGAQSDRRLGIPGEDLAGSHPATIFVGWYNGHPDFADLDFDLSHQRAIVIGNGNVAVDVARILVRSVDELAATDMADHAVTALQNSRVREVVMLGRRGPAQASFTSAELKEFGQLAGVEVSVAAEQLELDDTSQALIDEERRVRRNLEILADFAGRERTGANRTIELRFLASPVEILGTDGQVTGLRIERNRLETGADGYQRAVGTGEFETLDCGLVLRSVGYRGVAIPGVPFCERRGIIPNEQGRVTDGPGGSVRPGEYVVGWIKRGPSGIIGTNKPDAVETVGHMLQDAGNLDREAVDPDPEAVVACLRERGIRFVSYEDWKRIDAEERARGEPHGRPRSKIVRIEDMLGVCQR